MNLFSELSIIKGRASLRTYFQTHRGLLINFLSLGLVQLTNFLLPLITFPYLFRVLGVERFGTVTYALSVIVYLTALTDYGFVLSAPKAVAVIRHDRAKLSSLVSAILYTKLLLLAVVTGLMIALLFIVPRFGNEVKVYMLGLLYVAGYCILPVWIFLGMEQMKHVTWINLVMKGCSTAGLFLFIHTSSQYVYVVGLYGAANLVSGLIGSIYAWKRYQLKFPVPSWPAIWKQLKEGWYFFLSNLSTIVFGNTAIIVLGFFVADALIGKYSIAEKIVMAGWQVVSIFSYVTYPVVCRLAAQSHTALLRFIKQVHLPFAILMGLLCISLYAGADMLIYIATGGYQEDTSQLLRILSFLPVAACLNVSASQTLLAYQQQKQHAFVYNLLAITNILITISLTLGWGIKGTAWAALVGQLLLTIWLHMLLHIKFPTFALFGGRN